MQAGTAVHGDRCTRGEGKRCREFEPVILVEITNTVSSHRNSTVAKIVDCDNFILHVDFAECNRRKRGGVEQARADKWPQPRKL